MLPALIQGPLSRFGDTAANTGALAALEDMDIPPAAKTLLASLAAGFFRIFLMPVDAVKTIMQVEGKNGIPALMAKMQKGGPGVLYHGAVAASAATFVGHYPWFAVYNTLNDLLPKCVREGGWKGGGVQQDPGDVAAGTECASVGAQTCHNCQHT